MKLSLRILPILVFLSSSIFAQNSYVQWSHNLGGAGYDALLSVVGTMDAGSVSAGFTISSDRDAIGNHKQYSADAWVVKQKADGSKEWTKTYGGTQSDYFYGILQTPDSGFICVGSTNSRDGDVQNRSYDSLDVWVVKLNADGSIAWQKTYGGYGNDEGHAITATTDSGFIIAGYTRSNNGQLNNNHGNKDYWIFKIKKDGTMVWNVNYGGGDDEEANALAATADGGCIVTGYTKSVNKYITVNHGWVDIWTIKLASDGSMQWQRSIGGGSYDNAYSIIPTLDSAYILAGETYSRGGDVKRPVSDSGSAWLVKLSLKGAILWQKCYGGSGSNSASCIVQLKDTGAFVVCGATTSTEGSLSNNHGGGDAWVMKFKLDSFVEWQKTYGGSKNDYASCIALASDSGYLFVGDTKSYNGDLSNNYDSSWDAWAVKLNSKILGIENQEHNNFGKIYPNPVTDQLHIQLNQLNGRGRLEIFDLQGRLLATENIGSSNYNLDVSYLKTSIYILKLYTNNEVWTTKFIKE